MPPRKRKSTSPEPGPPPASSTADPTALSAPGAPPISDGEPPDGELPDGVVQEPLQVRAPAGATPSDPPGSNVHGHGHGHGTGHKHGDVDETRAHDLLPSAPDAPGSARPKR